MASLWTILLDTSGSMSEGFKGEIAEAEFGGTVETGAYESKIAAALAMLRKQVRGLPDSDVILIGFASSPSLIFRGKSSEFDLIDQKISQLRADGNTNVANAIDFATRAIAEHGQYDSISILIISDGLANDPNQAIEAARSCVAATKSHISTILIDPTHIGNAWARKVSIGGEVRAVTSSSTLQVAIAEQRAHHIDRAMLSPRRYAAKAPAGYPADASPRYPTEASLGYPAAAPIGNRIRAE